MSQITIGEQDRLSRSSLCSFLHCPVTSSLLGLLGVHAKTLYATLLSPIAVTCPAHLILPGLIARIMFAVTESIRCKLQSIPPPPPSAVQALAPSSRGRLRVPSHSQNLWTSTLTDRSTRHRHLPEKTEQTIIICHNLTEWCVHPLLIKTIHFDRNKQFPKNNNQLSDT
jgi:hypothetical protein